METTATRLYQLLTTALQERGDFDPAEPVTVAEIYQELVPYREIRDLLGVELNADYEHALLTLLAGHEDLMRLEPSSARDELREELESTNPYVGIYRKFAACDVWIEGVIPAQRVPAPTTEPSTPDSPPPTTEAQPAEYQQPEQQPPFAPEVETIVAPAIPPAPSMGPEEPAIPVTSPASVAEPVPTRSGGAGSCPYCAGMIPTGRDVNYCPFCGKDQSTRPCASCGEIVEEGWRYCISCGSVAAIP